MTLPITSPSHARRGLRPARVATLLGLLALPGLAAPALADPPPPAAAPAPDAVVTVTAKLVEIPGKFPEDDLYDYAYVMRYVVEGGPMDNQTILVAHYKPRQPRSASCRAPVPSLPSRPFVPLRRAQRRRGGPRAASILSPARPRARWWSGSRVRWAAR